MHLRSMDKQNNELILQTKLGKVVETLKVVKTPKVIVLGIISNFSSIFSKYSKRTVAIATCLPNFFPVYCEID